MNVSELHQLVLELEKEEREETEEKDWGLAIHYFHDELISFCWDYGFRQYVIKTQKPKKEQSIRLEVFKLLPDEAVNDLPEELKKAYENRLEVGEYEAYEVSRMAHLRWEREYHDWSQKARKAFHDKWCGCKYYDVKSDKLIFDKVKKSKR